MSERDPAAARPRNAAATPPSLRACTFLLTDIEGSTRLWERHTDEMRAALRRHDALLRGAVERHGGEMFKQVGDAFLAVFPENAGAAGAVAAAVEAQQALCRDVGLEGDPDAPALRVRMALYSGEVEARDGDYYGPTLNRGARVRDALHGGQIALAEPTRALLLGADGSPPALPEGATLRDLGPHRLRDLSEAERLYQVVHPDLPDDFPALRTLSGLPNNLPYLFTSFVGREREMEEVRGLLSATGPGRPRLVTLTGTGGTGKTRLSIQVGADVLDRFPGGVYLAELGAATEPEGAVAAVAAAVGAREEPGRPHLDALTDHLCRRRPLLLILDNCEHLVDACARLADHVLRRCPDVVILASSREPLGLPGEAAYPVPPLPSGPDGGRAVARLSPAEAVRSYPAVRLFVDRATAASHRFTLTEQNLPAVAEICRRLDGLPLAIELAAAWVGSVPPEQIVARLPDRFRLLKDGNRAAPTRHQTLRAAIDWSYDLLSAPERLLLQRLSVFSGGMTPEAAERVCAGDGLPREEVFTSLLRLARKSLVAQDEVGEREDPPAFAPQLPLRYRLLESIREYGRELLAAAPTDEAAPLRARHLDCCLALAEEAEPHLFGPSPRPWLDRLESEHGNLRAALFSDGDLEKRLRLATSVYWFWRLHGHFQEGCRHFARLLAEMGTAGGADGIEESLHARALKAYGILAWSGGDYPTARARLEESLELFRGLEASTDVVSCVNNLGLVAHKMGEFEQARRYYSEAYEHFRAKGELHRAATAQGNLGGLLNDIGELEEARSVLQAARELHRSIGNRTGLGTVLITSGQVDYKLGEYRRARECLLHAISLRHSQGDRNGVAPALAWLAMISHHEGDDAKATMLLGAADALRQEVGQGMSTADARLLENMIETTRNALGSDLFQRRWEEGSRLSLESATLFAGMSSHPVE